MDCSSVAVRNDFTEYAHSLLSATHGDLDLLSHCRKEVCTALWGAENSDISGIGMIVGYILDHALGLFLSVSISTLYDDEHRYTANVLRSGLRAFHECASFFAFSIEVASIVLLVKVDLGISTSGMGDDTTRTNYAVAMLVLLPLAYNIVLVPAGGRVSSSKAQARFGERAGGSKDLMLLVVCWALAFYPFYSAMNASFGPSKISSAETAALTPDQMQVIEGICFRGVNAISKTEAHIMITFVVLTYVPLSISLISSIIWSGIKSNHEGSSVHRKLEKLRGRISGRAALYGRILALTSIPALATGLMWTVFRARQAQRELARSLGTDDDGNNWTFGQVAAVTLFAPVFFECWNEYVVQRRAASGGLCGSEAEEAP